MASTRPDYFEAFGKSAVICISDPPALVPTYLVWCPRGPHQSDDLEIPFIDAGASLSAPWNFKAWSRCSQWIRMTDPSLFKRTCQGCGVGLALSRHAVEERPYTYLCRWQGRAWRCLLSDPCRATWRCRIRLYCRRR